MSVSPNIIYATSLEEVPITVTPPAGINPVSSTVQMAFLSVSPPTQPTSPQWNTAAWSPVAPPYTALCLVGPGGTITLTPGLWYAWIKITLAPEAVIRFAGTLTVN